MLKIKDNKKYFSLIALTSFNGMLSQMLIGYAAGVVTGAHYQRYALVMGTVTFSMGVGAWLLESLNRPRAWLMRAQWVCPAFLMLALLPTSMNLSDSSQFQFFTSTGHFLLQIVAMVMIGIFAGGELPLIARLYSTTSQNDQHFGHSLYVDYLAMAAALILFSFLAIQLLGVWGCFALILVLHCATYALLRGQNP